MNILVINAGSSGLKGQGVATNSGGAHGQSDVRLCRGEVKGIGGEAIVSSQDRHRAKREFTAPMHDNGNGNRGRACLEFVIE